MKIITLVAIIATLLSQPATDIYVDPIAQPIAIGKGMRPVSEVTVDIPEVEVVEMIEEEPIPEIDAPMPCDISEADVCLIALLTMAEAEGESEYGKRLVIDSVLNRVDSKHFPNNVYDVIYQPKHYSPIWDGRISKCIIKEDICQLVREEANSRTNYDVIFFCAGGYSKYGEPMFKEGGHYFSKYKEEN